MATAATIVSKLILEDDGFDAGISKAQKSTNSFHDNFLNKLKNVGSQLADLGRMVATTFAVGAVVAIGALTAELNRDIQAAMEAQEVQAQLNSVLESTGGIAGVSADQVNALADSLSKVTKFDDEAIVSGESLLLTFTNIGKDVFPLATETMLDMSEALGQDLKSSAIQIGKALQDPIQGVTALSRVGVNFTEEQQKMIKTLVDSGDLLGAQTMILNELQTEFGGSARAAGKTFAGQLTILQNRLGNIRENIGMKLLPVLSDLATMFNDYLSRPEVQAFLEDLGTAVADFAETAIAKLPDVFRTIREGFDWLMNNKGVIVAVLAVLTAAMVAFAWSTIAAAAPIVLVLALIGVAAYLLYTAWTQNWGGIQEKAAAFWAWLQPILIQIRDWLAVNIPAAILELQEWWSNTLPIIEDAWEAISDAFEEGMEFIYDLTHGNLGALSEIWDTTTGYIKDLTSRWFTQIKLLFQLFKAAFEGDWRKFGEILRQMWDNAWGGIVSLVSTAGSNIRSALQGAVNSIISWWNGIDWAQLGRTLITRIAQGLTGALPTLLTAAGNVFDALGDFLSGFFGGSSGGGYTFPTPPPGSGGGYANGSSGWRTVPAGFSDDNYMIGLSSGEEFNVVKKGQSASGGSGTVNYYHPQITIVTGKQDPKKSMKGFV